MDLNVESSGATRVVAVRGSLDALTAPELEDTFSKELRAEKPQLVADLSGLAYSSSAGLRVLLNVVKQARQKGGDLRLAAVQPNVQKVLELSGFNSIIKSFDKVDDAVASY